MKKNIYSVTAIILIISSFIVSIGTFIGIGFDYSPGKTSEMILNMTAPAVVSPIIFLIMFYLGLKLYKISQTKELPLMHIKDWPKYLKIYGLISILLYLGLIILLLKLWIPCIDGCDMFGESFITVLFIFPFSGLILLIWIGIFIFYNLRK